MPLGRVGWFGQAVSSIRGKFVEMLICDGLQPNGSMAHEVNYLIFYYNRKFLSFCKKCLKVASPIELWKCFDVFLLEKCEKFAPRIFFAGGFWGFDTICSINYFGTIILLWNDF